LIPSKLHRLSLSECLTNNSVRILHCGWSTHCLDLQVAHHLMLSQRPPSPIFYPPHDYVHSHKSPHPLTFFFFILTLSLVLIFSTTDHTHASHTQLQIHSTSHHITTHINQPTYQSTNNYAVCTNFIRTNNTSNDDFFNHTPRRRRSPAQHDQRHHYPRRRTPRLASPSRRARTAASRQRGNADCRLGWNW
jgi:hypothetical protein